MSTPRPIDVWRAEVEKGLKGKPFERLVKTGADGVAREPLHVAAPASASRVPTKRTPGWTIAQAYTNPSSAGAAREIAADLDAGVEAVVLVLDYAARLALAPTDPRARALIGKHGVAIHGAEDARELAAAIDSKSSSPEVYLDAGANAAEILALFGATGARLHACIDPLGTLVSDGTLPRSIETHAAEALEIERAHPGTRAWLASGIPYHEAGAHLVLELAATVATWVDYARRGASPSAIAVAIGGEADVPLGVAKARALRVLLAKAGAALDVAPTGDAFVAGMTSLRHTTRRDAESNILRATSETFALAVGGADVIITRPYDAALGGPSELARRVAKNVQLVLREEGHVGRVVDPLAGSFAVESMTDAIARAAWAELRKIEALGGMEAAVVSGAIQRQVRETFEKEQGAVAKRARTIVGVNAFAPLAKPGVVRDVTSRWPDRDARREAVAEAIVAQRGDVERSSGAPMGGPSVLRLDRVRDAERFESIRSEADDLTEEGARPRVVFASIGELAELGPRIDFVARFFEVGGFDVAASPVAADVETPSFAAPDVVVLVGSDATYAARGAEALGRLRASNPKAFIALAGRAGSLGDALAAAAPSTDVFVGCDAVSALATALQHVRATRHA